MTRAWRIRRWARRELDHLLEAPDPWDFSVPVGDPYHDSYLDRGWVEREIAGRELAEAAWCP